MFIQSLIAVWSESMRSYSLEMNSTVKAKELTISTTNKIFIQMDGQDVRARLLIDWLESVDRDLLSNGNKNSLIEYSLIVYRTIDQ